MGGGLGLVLVRLLSWESWGQALCPLPWGWHSWCPRMGLSPGLGGGAPTSLWGCWPAACLTEGAPSSLHGVFFFGAGGHPLFPMGHPPQHPPRAGVSRSPPPHRGPSWGLAEGWLLSALPCHCPLSATPISGPGAPTVPVLVGRARVGRGWSGWWFLPVWPPPQEKAGSWSSQKWLLQ